MWGLLRTRRWLSFTATALIAILAFGFLSRWQWQRAHEEDAKAQDVSQAASGQPADISTVPIAEDPPPQDEYLVVSANGELHCESGYLVRNRPLGGQAGFWVACPLRLDSGEWVWINRGWVAAQGVATAVQPMPPAPSGRVDLVGHLRSTQVGPNPQPSDLPAGQVTHLDTAVLSQMAALEGAVYSPYIEATTMTPADPGGLEPLPLPTRDSAMNYSYAGQWLLFALVAICGWFYFLRREAKEGAPVEDRIDQPTR